MDLQGRYRGCLLGLAAGDALGTTLEFTHDPPPIDDIVGGGPFRLQPGQWTDDTSMALCLAESLLECDKFDANDQLERYWRWYRDGHLSSTGRCFDIGVTTRDALERWARTSDPYAGSTDAHTAGNGSLMRLAPIPMWFRTDPTALLDAAADSSRTTHGARESVDACRYYAGLVAGALAGVARDELLSPRWSPRAGAWQDGPLTPKIDAIAAGSFKGKARADIKSGGYVVESLEAALWGFAQAEDFRHGALMVVNLGHDADTTGAIYGMLAGAYFGVDGIPDRWLQKLALRDTIEGFADRMAARG